MSEFTCDGCKKSYPKRNDDEWNDAKAEEEWRTLYPETIHHPTNILCDPCNDKFLKWFETLTDDQKKKMRDDFERENNL